MLHGRPSSRFLNVFACCIAKIVVGTKTATCLLSATALKAALIAISVFPKPTSPQTSLSIGMVFSISCFTAIVVFNWSGVSSYIKDASNSCCKKLSGENSKPTCSFLLAYSLIRSYAIFLTLVLVLDLVFCH